MSTYTVGTITSDYADFTAAWNDKCNGKTLAENIVFNIVASHTLSGAISGMLTLGGHSLEIKNDDAGKPNGVLTAGYIMELNGNIRMDIATGSTGGGTVNIHDVSFKESSATPAEIEIVPWGSSAVQPTRYIYFENNILNNVSLFLSCTYNNISRATNLKMYISGGHSGSAMWLAGVKYVGANQYGTAEHITVYNFDGIGFSADGAWQSVKNIVSCGTLGGAGDKDYSVINPPVTFNNCADSDGSLIPLTDVDCISNITEADEFISIDPTNADFLKLKTTGSLADGGMIPVYATADIAGVAIPDYAGWYPIGCHCAQTVPIGHRQRLISIF